MSQVSVICGFQLQFYDLHVHSATSVPPILVPADRKERHGHIDTVRELATMAAQRAGICRLNELIMTPVRFVATWIDRPALYKRLKWTMELFVSTTKPPDICCPFLPGQIRKVTLCGLHMVE